MSRRALFVTFEGAEGSGKSTQARLLYERLRQGEVAAVLTHEPGGTTLGDQIRHLLLGEAAGPITPRAELLLFAAARAQLTYTVIEPALLRGEVVICDRFAESSLAYQGYGRGLGREEVQATIALATGQRRSDLVVLLDLPVNIGLGRKGLADWNRFERQELAFHERVRAGYRKMAAAEPDRWLVIDARLDAQEIATRIWERVRAELGLTLSA